ncbi:Uncharacterised protein [Anaerotruncus sp. 2789STDY5834896]|uniref:Transcobalamin-like C-terminal domain-containing protein n=1 Tax=uncultured Anaerotruncus sp. TaxID=905011 RepID=A0A1C6FLL5_9FIRM|nr:Uncharacterised protein [uncultured Anaerotruncus sp.]
MKHTRRQKLILAVSAFILLAACVGGWLLYRRYAPQGQTGDKQITVQVIQLDGNRDSHTYRTDEAYLGAVLTANHLVAGEEGAYGLFITTVDGVAADQSRQQWWCLTKGGEQVNTSADQTPIADGDTFELTLTEGY